MHRCSGATHVFSAWNDTNPPRAGFFVSLPNAMFTGLLNGYSIFWGPARENLSCCGHIPLSGHHAFRSSRHICTPEAKDFFKKNFVKSLYPSSGVIRFNRCPDAVFFPKAEEDQRFRIRSCFSFQYLQFAVIDIITLLTSQCYVG